MDEEKKNALRDKLNAIHIWPSVYMYKFIFETDHDKLIQIQTIFGESAQFIKRESANGKYTSLTIKEMMLDADSIFARYEQMAAVPGIIRL